VLTRRDLDQIAERLGVPAGPAVPGAALLRERLGEAYLLIDALAREPDGRPCGHLVLAARALLAQHGRPPWFSPKEVAGEKA
jgi:hypothetical protein